MDLFEYLALILDCTYISDLKYITADKFQLYQVSEIPDKKFSLEEYNKVATYLLHSKINFQNIPEAKEAIMDCLSNKNI